VVEEKPRKQNMQSKTMKKLAAGFCAKGRNPADDKEKDSYF